MNPEADTTVKSGRYRPKTVLILVCCIVVITALSLLAAAYYPGELGSAQPISFSHRVHAGTKEIGCLVCHPNTLTGPVAGMPPVETCMLCHKRIAVHLPEIEKVRRHYATNEPIWWVRVSQLPDHVRFVHNMHLVAGIDCGKCHGDVKAMDRIVPHQQFIMGFCIQCHRDYNATHDCFMCHH